MQVSRKKSQKIEEKNTKEKSAEKKTKLTMDEFCENELPFLAEVLGFSNSLEISTYVDSTVVKSPEVVYRGLTFSKCRYISEEFLLNFRRSTPDMSQMIGVSNFHNPSVIAAAASKKYKEDPKKLIPLPKYKKVNAPIGAVIRSRRSVREYSGNKTSLEDLSSILYYAQGISGTQEVENMPKSIVMGKTFKIDLHNAPSGGGLYPIDLYVFALNINDLDKGIYLYVPAHHALKKIRMLDDNFDVNKTAEWGDIEIHKSTMLLVFVYKIIDNSRKYGDSGLAYAFIEAGEISENIHLIATALGIGPCDIGGYSKHALENLIGIDGLAEHVIHLTVLGN